MLIDGILEIDRQRGVIYFHDQQGTTRLRICRLPKPIPDLESIDGRQIDLTIIEAKTNYIRSSNIEHEYTATP
jgi:hypothetical protein